MWKVVEAIIDNRVRESIRLHDVLHGFRSGRGMGMVILELNLAQELDRVYQYPLFLIFLDLEKSYNTVYRGNLLTDMEGYDTGPHMYMLLEVFWEQKEVVTLQNGYHSPQFKATRGTNQGEIISPTLFNLLLYNLASKWLALTVEDQLFAQEVLGLVVGRFLGLFYADNSMAGSQDPELLQGALNVLISLFSRYGLVANFAKSKAMACQPDTLRSWILEEAV